MNTYRNGGVSAHFTQIMKSLIGDVQKLKLTKEEVSLMAIMILLTPDRGTDVIQRDKRQLANIQVILFLLPNESSFRSTLFPRNFYFRNASVKYCLLFLRDKKTLKIPSLLVAQHVALAS